MRDSVAIYRTFDPFFDRVRKFQTCSVQSGIRYLFPQRQCPTLSRPSRSNLVFLDICSGVSRPLSRALRALHADVISFDLLLNPDMNLLQDESYETLLKLCSSGAVAYGSASPSCAQYSRLKLRQDGGPPPLRTPTHLQGVPGLSPQDLAKVQDSFVMLSRCLQCLTLVHASGGHVHLEQPSSAMSWLESETQAFVKNIGIFCINLAACHFGLDWHKNWMFASSYPPLSEMACQCDHPPGFHQPIAGQTNAAGDFLSRDTACYPDALAAKFATIVHPLLSSCDQDIPWKNCDIILPVKKVSDFPRSSEDGGGMFSVPDWSMAPRTAEDSFHELRKQWMSLVIHHRLDKKLVAFCQNSSADPPFNDADLVPFRTSLEHFFRVHDLEPDWTVRAHQPMHLQILQAFSQIMQDTDSDLFRHLTQGVSTGFQQDFPPSGCFPVNDRPNDANEPLSVHMSNWQSAEDNLPLTRELVQEEIDKGWVFQFPGSLSEAQAAYPVGVAIGKLGVAITDSRPPRLVVDNSICGLNNRCLIPERSTLPSAKDIIRSYPVRNTRRDLAGFSLDIKSAHKRIVLKDEEQGLVGFTLDEKLFFYRVCPFGASFSAAWWSRLGAFILRCFHRLIWLAHVAMLYVDDYFIYQDSQVLPCSASILCIFCLLTGIPISWRKCELSGCLKWIGWSFHIKCGFLSIPADKVTKVLEYLQDLQRNSRTSKKKLEKQLVFVCGSLNYGHICVFGFITGIETCSLFQHLYLV